MLFDFIATLINEFKNPRLGSADRPGMHSFLVDVLHKKGVRKGGC